MSLIKYPLSTEKSIRLMELENKLIFIVDRNSNKKEIKKELEKTYDVKIKKINTLITPAGKKKAYITFSDETPAIDLATKLGIM
ncbi:50S ribosomal protein L23 [Candidatus Woesearchaeota archaeon]|jgi:large subunit ribosomal protein L23|nr:50S ribosomal protein L23 [Candidatus Woesearchaeota archaeon]|tara:strand:+ start:328 stop:579 length:252 start_codon:yes stop_codon:yes gene_type:complete